VWGNTSASPTSICSSTKASCTLVGTLALWRELSLGLPLVDGVVAGDRHAGPRT
jgi:hypothetical protein